MDGIILAKLQLQKTSRDKGYLKWWITLAQIISQKNMVVGYGISNCNILWG